MLTTAEAAALLTERGVMVIGKGTEAHAPTARTVEAWCRSGALVCEHVGVGRRGMWLVSETALEDWTPPMMGRKRKPTA
jgi:hypothetical protein